MKDEEYRLLKADEIQCRAQTVKSYGFSLLLYKDARCDMSILDETYGRFNWQRRHTRDNHNCIIEVWDAGKGQWVAKEDVGTESYTEKEKGLASDSFKRAGFNWGIGRELYTAPFIWLEPKNGEIVQENNKYKLNRKAYFYVDHIAYNENRQITELVIKDKSDDVRFTHGNVKSKTNGKQETTDNSSKSNETKVSSSEQTKETSQSGRALIPEFNGDVNSHKEAIKKQWSEDDYLNEDKINKLLQWATDNGLNHRAFLNWYTVAFNALQGDKKKSFRDKHEEQIRNTLQKLQDG